MDVQPELHQDDNLKILQQKDETAHGEVRYEHQHNIIISKNGIRIASKLNPEAKEFYPSYMRAERIQQCLKEETKCEACILAHIVEEETKKTEVVDELPFNATFNILNKPLDGNQSENHTEDEQIVYEVLKELNYPVEIANESIEAVGDVAKVTTDDRILNNDIKVEPIDLIDGVVTSTDNSKDDATKGKMGMNEKSQVHKSTNSKCSGGQEKVKNIKATVPKDTLKKKDEKQSALRKLGKIMLGSSSKTVTTEKAKPQSTKSSISCTKRISESLHNLTSSLKSKTDLKGTDSGGTILPPRSSTAISRGVQMRSRTAAVKSSEVNGFAGESVKTSALTTTVKSTPIAEKSIVTKPPTFGQSKTTNRKLHSASPTKSSERSNTPVSGSSRPKEMIGSGVPPTASSVAPKLPRSTLSSALRQSEAQRRRHLFPSDDPESKANIELPQFLFK